MEELLTTLWGRCRALDVSRMDRGALGGLQAGCLRLYRLGLLFPWTLPADTDLVALHGRARAVAWRQDLLSCDAELPLAERAAHTAGLLGCYVVQTDGEFVTRGCGRRGSCSTAGTMSGCGCRGGRRMFAACCASAPISQAMRNASGWRKGW